MMLFRTLMFLAITGMVGLPVAACTSTNDDPQPEDAESGDNAYSMSTEEESEEPAPAEDGDDAEEMMSAEDGEGTAMDADGDDTAGEEVPDLQARLDERAGGRRNELFEAGIEDVEATGVMDRAINVGDTAPNFTLMNQSGEPVTLYDRLADGPVVLIWYRGGWCPYCNIYLAGMAEVNPMIVDRGASVVAVSPDISANVESTVEEYEVNYTVLADPGMEAARTWDIVYPLLDGVADRLGPAIHRSGGLGEHEAGVEVELPLSATYVIGTDRVVTYAFMHKDYKKRAQPQEILDALDRTE